MFPIDHRIDLTRIDHFFVDKGVGFGNLSTMVKAITSLLLVFAVVFAPMATVEAKPRPTAFKNFQQTLNKILRESEGPAARNRLISAYRRFLLANRQNAFPLARMVTVALDSVTPVGPLRAANTLTLATVSTGVQLRSESVSISTFTYLVSTLPAESRTPENVRFIADAAKTTSDVASEQDTIFNEIIGGAGTPIPSS